MKRDLLLTAEKTWEGLDDPHWVTEPGKKGKEQECTEGTEAFFQEVY